MLLEKIINKENRKQKDLNELKASSIPNIIYGVGNYATCILKYLERNGIKIDVACVDDEYIGTCDTHFRGIDVTTLKQVCKTFKQFNVILGFADYKNARKKVENIPNIEATYFLDTPTYTPFFDYQYIVDHINEFENIYNLLQDKQSKETLVAFINSKISGEPYGLYELMDQDQYFNDLVPFGSNEVFIDCGAYNGDTILGFVNKVGKEYKKIYAFEPDDINNDILIKTVEKNNLHDIQIIKKGCWRSEAKLTFSSDGEQSTFNSNSNDIIIEVDAIDNIVQKDKVTFIKMDVEGSELDALQGAKKTIMKDKPNLAICVYHKPEDLLTIPQYILSIAPDYKFYLRHHQFISWETVLYAIAK